MKTNYYFLWNYNKIPFVYSIMKKNEKNILIINIKETREMKDKFLQLKNLEKIEDIVFLENSLKEYILNIGYRIFIYPFKSKKEKVIFYFDGFRGYYPIKISNLGKPCEVNFYEEGESIYLKSTLFEDKKHKGIKNKVNKLIKKILFVKKNKVDGIKIFYLRDKNKFEKMLQKNKLKIEFNIEEIDEVKEIKEFSIKDKELLKSIFLAEIEIEGNTERKKAIVLTQPLYKYNILNKEETKFIFNNSIKKLKEEGYEVYLKLHPLESEDIYEQENVVRIKGSFPFELLTLLDIEFEKGVTFNSTSINCSLIKEKILLNKDYIK